ncbi:hypothetical protein PXD04_07940 [Methanosphaera sp. ISO3-F5]|nr:hypothetical protein [Methanosphaera sp. ISO3-F5]WQH63625.1 hypothetical protein PXD04_07940 [Methanosphaera sp. ISO3-F5]
MKLNSIYAKSRPEVHYVCHGIDEERLPNQYTHYKLTHKELLTLLSR